MLGARLGPYRLDAELGIGGMGKVYAATVVDRALDLEEGARVALKIVHPHLLETPGFFKRFLREAEVGRSVRHENVVRTFDCDAISMDGVQQNFLVMELVEGQTLRELVVELGRVPEELCRHVGVEVARGLAAIHARDVVHRDMKPENVLITPDQVVKIMDLGVARLADEALRLSQTGAFVGSMLYAAPEQFRNAGGRVDPRTDLHAVGLVLYELAGGINPYEAGSLPEVVKLVMFGEPRRLGDVNPQISPFFEEVVHTLLAKDPEERFATAEELAEVLDAGEESPWWVARATTIQKLAQRPRRRVRVPRETELYGRDQELAKLTVLYEKARAGQGQALLVEGEPGIGKTRLVDAFVGRLHEQGEDVHFLFGAYAPSGAATAAGGFSSAYREQFGELDIEEAVEPYLSSASALVSAFAALLLGVPTPSGVEPLNKEAIHTAFIQVTRALAAERPTIVLIDDLHNAPDEGRALFTSLALGLINHRVLLVATAREELPEDWAVEIERMEHGSRLDLPRLGAKDLVLLLEDSFRSGLAQRLSGQIALKSDGNPFFVFEIIRGLREAGVITQSEDGSWITTGVIEDIQIPSSILDLVEARLADVSEEDRELLDVAAVCGFEFDGGLVAEVLGTGRIPTLRRLGRLEQRHRLVRSVERRFAFDHHQVRDALYERLSPMLREEYHAALAETLEAREGAANGDAAAVDQALAAELCRHYLDGRRADRALRYLDGALQHLEGGYLFADSIELTRRVLAEPGLVEAERRLELLLSIGKRLGSLGRQDECRSALDEARELAEEGGTTAALCRVDRQIARHLANVGESAEAEQVALRALDLARASGTAREQVMAEISLGTVRLAQGRVQEAREDLTNALRGAAAHGDSDLEDAANADLGIANWYLGHWEEAQSQFERRADAARLAGDVAGECGAAINASITLFASGRIAVPLERLEQAIELGRRAGFRKGELVAHENLAELALVVGDGARAGVHLDTCLELARKSRNQQAESIALRQAAELHARRRDVAEAERLLVASLQLARRIGHHVVVADALVSFGSFLADSARNTEAKALLEEAHSLAVERSFPGPEVIAAARLASLGSMDASTSVEAYSKQSGRMRAIERMQARFLHWQLTEELTYLAESWSLLETLHSNAPGDRREGMLTDVPLHRDIVAAWKEHGAGA